MSSLLGGSKAGNSHYKQIRKHIEDKLHLSETMIQFLRQAAPQGRAPQDLHRYHGRIGRVWQNRSHQYRFSLLWGLSMCRHFLYAVNGRPSRAGGRGVPGATKIASTVGAWASFQRSACSRPPLPTSRMRSGSSPLSTNAMSAGCMPGSDNWFLGQPKGLPVRKLKFRSEERRRSWRTWIVCYSKDQQRPIIFSLITNFFHHRRLHRHESFSLSVRPL